MSTIVVVKKDGWAAIGADTLTSYGSTRQSAEYLENHSKINQVGDSYLAIVGHGSWNLVLTSYFAQLETPPPLHSRQTIFETARRMHLALKEDYFLNSSEDEDDEFETSQLGCLIANGSGIYGLYPHRSVSEFRKFYAFGSGFRFALGAMHALYATAASAEEIARAGLEAAAEFDNASQRPLEIRVLPLLPQTREFSSDGK